MTTKQNQNQSLNITVDYITFNKFEQQVAKRKIFKSQKALDKFIENLDGWIIRTTTEE